MTASGFGRVLFVSIAAAFVVVGAYGTWWTHNVTKAAGNAVGTGFVVLGVVPAPQADPPKTQLVARDRKGAFRAMPKMHTDPEEAGDLADADEALERHNSSKHVMIAKAN